MIIFDLAVTGWVWAATVGSGSAIALILVFVAARRWLRERYFRKRDRIAGWVRQNWDAIVACRIAPQEWRSSPVTKLVVEEIALDRMAVAATEEAGRLGAFLRESGLLDQHKHAAQRASGRGRSLSIQVLGRMRDVESLPLLIKALEDPSDEVVFQAIRALGSIGGPEAGAAIVERLTRPLVYAPAPVEAALVNCFRNHPERLVRAAQEVAGRLRSMLLRVLAEVATADLAADVTDLAADPDADVRASAARMLAVTRQAGGATTLCRLAADPEWFVRLRAMAALGGLRDPYTIPNLIHGLCDRNRLVRLRAASSLAGMDCLPRVLKLADSTGDRYALQAVVSELERAGKLECLLGALGAGGDHSEIENALLLVLKAGSVRLLAQAAREHPDPRVREKLRDMLGRSDEPAVRAYLEGVELAPPPAPPLPSTALPAETGMGHCEPFQTLQSLATAVGDAEGGPPTP